MDSHSFSPDPKLPQVFTDDLPPALPAKIRSLQGDHACFGMACNPVGMVARRAVSVAAKHRARQRAAKAARTKRRMMEVGDNVAAAGDTGPPAAEPWAPQEGPGAR